MQRRICSKMEEISFDTKLFIDEIEKRPVIWDMTSRKYSNKNLKRKAWEELSNIFCEADGNDGKINIIGSSLQKKWKSLRDNYMREIKKLKNIRSGLEASKKSPYIHFNKLKFLQTSIENNDTESNFSTINKNLNDQYRNEESVSTNTATDSNTVAFKSSNDIHLKEKKIKLNPVDKIFVNILEKSLAQKSEHKIQEEDEDKLFCLSLYKEIKKVPESRRLKAKIKIYDLILKNQNIYPHQLQPQEFQSASICPSSQHRNDLTQNSLQSHNLASTFQGYQIHDQHFNQNVTNYDCPTSMEIPSSAITNNSKESESDFFGRI